MLAVLPFTPPFLSPLLFSEMIALRCVMLICPMNCLERKNTDAGTTNEEDMFDVALEDAAKDDRRSKSARNGDGDRLSRQGKRQKKDQKFGAEYCTDGSTTHVVGAKYTSLVC